MGICKDLERKNSWNSASSISV